LEFRRVLFRSTPYRDAAGAGGAGEVLSSPAPLPSAHGVRPGPRGLRPPSTARTPPRLDRLGTRFDAVPVGTVPARPVADEARTARFPGFPGSPQNRNGPRYVQNFRVHPHPPFG